MLSIGRKRNEAAARNSCAVKEENAMLSLLVFLVILVFQAAINKLSEGCSRLSAYIQAFLEEDTDDVWHWERHRFRINSYVWSKHNYNGIHRLYNLASRNGTVCFGIVSIIICALQ